jgi:hypothetical protein
MKAAKARGVHCGTTSRVPLEIVERIVDERLSGKPWQHIADSLDDDGIETARGASMWQVGSVQSVFNSIRGVKVRDQRNGLNMPEGDTPGIISELSA